LTDTLTCAAIANVKKNPTQRVNKSEWIRSQPASVPARDVVDLAKKGGITLSLAQVYTARSAAKKQKQGDVSVKKPGRPTGRLAASAAASPAASSKSNGNGHDDIRKEFVRIAMRIGTDQARDLLDRIVDQQQI
jgi:hypothetical protein